MERLTIPTLPTEANRSAGRDDVQVMSEYETAPDLAIPRARRSWGVLLERQARDHYDDCLPEGYCSFIRRGIKIPHQRHWNRLQAVYEGDFGSIPSA